MTRLTAVPFRFRSAWLIALTLAGVFLYASVAAQGTSDALPVIVQRVEIKPLENRIEGLGNLRANESVRLTSNVTKTVTAINFEDGQRVERGQVLVEMTSAEERALLEEARINADEAERQLERVRSLVATNAASQSLLDQRQREFDAARARYHALSSRLEDLQIAAPFSGVVGLRNVSVGALVSPGDLITTLNDDSQMKLDFPVPSIHLRALRIGLPVVARSRALGDREFSGEVVSIDNQIDPVTRAVTVRAIIPNDDGLLKQGMLLSVLLLADQRESLVISEAALVPSAGRNYVFVVPDDSETTEAERRAVRIGQRLVGQVEILDGLDAGERVVTHGTMRVRDGSKVRVIAEEGGDEALSDVLQRVGN